MRLARSFRMALPLLCVVSFACAPVAHEDRIVTTLGEDDYALFRVAPGGAERLAVLVELRDPPDGTYVLLYSPEPPESTGWFFLDTGSIDACRRYGDDASSRVELDCLVPDGHGAVVDLVTVACEPTFTSPASRGCGATTRVLRHELSRSETPRGESSGEKRVAPSGYYAVMRVERGGTGPIEIAIEAQPFGEEDRYAEPSVEQLQ